MSDGTLDVKRSQGGCTTIHILAKFMQEPCAKVSTAGPHYLTHEADGKQDLELPLSL